ncbi:MAG: rhamnan synthesis F family protein [Alkalilacustris sp.]
MQSEEVMGPKKKLSRELTRIGQQIRGVVEHFTDPRAQRRLDMAIATGLPTLNGAVPLRNKVALMLVWQPAGLAASTLATCRWLAGAGYAPLVVSNAPLSEPDRRRLCEVIWRVVVRPNFGYDFGGYRDGLTHLRKWGVVPDEVLIINDSVWLPVLPETDLLDRLSRYPADVAGTILRRRGEEQFLESYLYRLRRSALEHPAFEAYWRQLRLTSNKYHTIRRGERGFSAAMRRAGLQVAGVYDDGGLIDRILEQDDEFLRLTLRHAAHIDTCLAADCARLAIGTGPRWRAEVNDHLQETFRKRMGYSTFPVAAVGLMHYPLLKKSSDSVAVAWRRAFLEAVEAGAVPRPQEVVLSEVRNRDVRC